MKTSARWLCVAVAFGAAACVAETPLPEDSCANLRGLQSRQGSQIQGAFGVLDAFTISADTRGEVIVTPPDASPCARDLAAKLEGACRVCDAAPGACEGTVTQILDQPTAACSACGNDTCEPGESARDCPEDCGAACGDGACQGGESAVSCPEDCGTACGDGACQGDESARSCPEDCGAACGDGACEPGESPSTCPRDCAATCGDDACEQGESPVLCPEDCGGCAPNAATCDGDDTLVRCDPDGLSSTRRACGEGQRCQSGACVAQDEPEPDPAAEIEALLLGHWRATVRLRADNAVQREVEVGNLLYNLEIFEVEPPSDRFGIWGWSGAVKATSLCLIPRAKFEDSGGECDAFEGARLGSCSGASCMERREAAARGVYDAVRGVWTMEANVTDADAWFQDGSGYINARLDLSGEGALSAGQIAQGECARSCTWSVTADGAYDDDYRYYGGSRWSVTFTRISQ